MNWPELSCLSHHCCFCWTHTGLWVASFLGSGSLCHQSPHWKLSPAGHGQLSAVPTLLCPAGWMFGVPELHAGVYWSNIICCIYQIANIYILFLYWFDFMNIVKRVIITNLKFYVSKRISSAQCHCREIKIL